jgi:hypothetical protein
MKTELFQLNKLAKALEARGHTVQAHTVRGLTKAANRWTRPDTPEEEVDALILELTEIIAQVFTFNGSNECSWTDSDSDDVKDMLLAKKPVVRLFTSTDLWDPSGRKDKHGRIIYQIRGHNKGISCRFTSACLRASTKDLLARKGELEEFVKMINLRLDQQSEAGNTSDVVYHDWLIPSEEMSREDIAYWALGDGNSAKFIPKGVSGDVISLPVLPSQLAAAIIELRIFQKTSDTKLYKVRGGRYHGEFAWATETPTGSAEWLYAVNPTSKDFSGAKPHVYPFPPAAESNAEDGVATALGGDHNAIVKSATPPPKNQKPIDENAKEVTHEQGGGGRIVEQEGKFFAGYDDAEGAYIPVLNPETNDNKFDDKPSAGKALKAALLAAVKPPKKKSESVATSMKVLSDGKIYNSATGDAFRRWVHKSHKNYLGKGYKDLDLSGKWNNRYMRTAWKALGDKYNVSSGVGLQPDGTPAEAGTQALVSVDQATLKAYMLYPKPLINRDRFLKQYGEEFTTKTLLLANTPDTVAARDKTLALFTEEGSMVAKSLSKEYNADTSDATTGPSLKWTIRKSIAANADKKTKDKEDADKATKAKKSNVNVSDFYRFGPEGADFKDDNTSGLPPKGTLYIRRKDGEFFYLAEPAKGKFTLANLIRRQAGWGLDSPGLSVLSKAETERLLGMVAPASKEKWELFLSDKAEYSSELAKGRGEDEGDFWADGRKTDREDLRKSREGLFGQPQPKAEPDPPKASTPISRPV